MLVINNEKLEAVQQKLPTLMQEYYEQVDNMEKKRLRDHARQKFTEIMLNHKKYELAEKKLQEEQEAAAAAGEEQKRGIIEEENQNKRMMDKLQTW